MKTLIIIGLLLLAWVIVSKVITVILLGKSDNTVGAGVFLMIILLPMMLVAFIQQDFEKFSKYIGYPVEPKENPMDYLS